MVCRLCLETIVTVRITRTFPLNQHVTSFIDGAAVTPKPNGHDIEVVNPTTEQVISRLREADAAEVDAAVSSARRAFDSGRWPLFQFQERELKQRPGHD